MSNFDKAIEIILAEPPELHYPAYYADLLRQADVPDMNIGKCSEIPNSSDLNKFIDGLEEIFADIRERHGDDSVCGLCEYDGAYIGQSGDWCNECPGFDRDDCFKLSDECRKRWINTITNSLPSAQPERTCVNCGRTANNGGWYADGGTRCPIEEHYALPKDGYCHLWEKRNVTDDEIIRKGGKNDSISD